MGTSGRFVRSNVRIGLLTCLCIMPMLVSCQAILPPVTSKRLIYPRPFLDLTGLLPREDVDVVAVSWAVPRDWKALPVKRGMLYSHQQYRSPTRLSGVGVVYIRMPIPLSASTIAWLAQNEYQKKSSDGGKGSLIARWHDPEGREWFEGQNDNYHAQGYIYARGNEAWIVYSGYRLTHPPELQEISVSQRSSQTISPKL